MEPTIYYVNNGVLANFDCPVTEVELGQQKLFDPHPMSVMVAGFLYFRLKTQYVELDD